MMLYKPDEWVFVHVPKNAGTSVQGDYTEMFFDNRGRGAEQRIKARKDQGVHRYFIEGETEHNKWNYWKDKPNVQDCSPVALLRNPWDRCLSIFIFSLERARKDVNEKWAGYDHPLLIRQGFKSSWMPGGYFVDGHAKHTEYNADTGRAWSFADEQFSWLGGEGKWFRLEDQMEGFYKHTGLPPPSERLNATKRGGYQAYYDSELAERIGELFARDIKVGGYVFQ